MSTIQFCATASWCAMQLFHKSLLTCSEYKFKLLLIGNSSVGKVAAVLMMYICATCAALSLGETCTWFTWLTLIDHAVITVDAIRGQELPNGIY